MSWTLEYDGTTKTLSDWGADDSAELTLQNQTPGALTLHFPGMMDDAVPCAYKGKIILRLGNEIIFRGIAMEPEREGEGEQEGITIRFVDVWWYLTVGTITQTINDRGQITASRTGTLTSGSAAVAVADITGLAVGMTVVGTGVPSETTILSIGTGTFTMSANATVSGDETLRFLAGIQTSLYALFGRLRLGNGVLRRTIAETLSDIIAACDAHHGGGVIQFGACHGDAFALLPQPIDIQGTFDTAAKAALGFAPDAMSYVDPTTNPPTLSFYQRAAAPVKSLAFADESVMISQEIRERRDLLISGVRIIYHRFLIDGTPVTTWDTAGDTSGPGVLQVEMQLYDATRPPKAVPAVTEQQWLKSVPINQTDRDWWFDNADLGVDDSSGIIVGSGTVLELDPNAPENAGVTDLTDLNGCTNRIVEGNVPGWLNDSAHLRYVRVRGYLTLQIWHDDAHTPGDYDVVKRRITLSCAATDLGTNLYENTIVAGYVDGTFDPENPPIGVAAAILAAQSVLQYQGAVTLIDEECATGYWPGQVLNVTGATQTAWATMNAQVQGVTHRLQTGTTVITFGPAEHLAPQDYLEIMRRLMRWKPALDLATRANGPSDSGGSDGMVHHPATQVRFGIQQSDNVQRQKDVDSTGSVERTTASGKQVMTDGTTTITLDCSSRVVSITGGGKSIVLDLDDLPDGAEARFIDCQVCIGGVSKTAKVLMTTPA